MDLDSCGADLDFILTVSVDLTTKGKVLCRNFILFLVFSTES